LGNVEEPLHHMYILKIHILNVYGQTDIKILLKHVVFVFRTCSIGPHKPQSLLPMTNEHKLYTI